MPVHCVDAVDLAIGCYYLFVETELGLESDFAVEMRFSPRPDRQSGDVDAPYEMLSDGKKLFFTRRQVDYADFGGQGNLMGLGITCPFRNRFLGRSCI